MRTAITDNIAFSFTLPENGLLWEQAAIVELLVFIGVFVVSRWSDGGFSLVHSAVYLNLALFQVSPTSSMDLAAGTQHMHAAIEEMELVAFLANPGIPWFVDTSGTLKGHVAVSAFECSV